MLVYSYTCFPPRPSMHSTRIPRSRELRYWGDSKVPTFPCSSSTPSSRLVWTPGTQTCRRAVPASLSIQTEPCPSTRPQPPPTSRGPIDRSKHRDRLAERALDTTPRASLCSSLLPCVPRCSIVSWPFDAPLLEPLAQDLLHYARDCFLRLTCVRKCSACDVCAVPCWSRQASSLHSLQRPQPIHWREEASPMLDSPHSWWQ